MGDYCFSSNNTSAARKKQNAKNRAHSRSNTVDITLSSSTTMNNGNGNGFQRNMHTHFVSTDHITESKQNDTNDQKDESDQLLVRNGGTTSTTKKSKKNKKVNHKLPVLKSGDIVTLKMKLNRNNGKFAVIYAVNEIDYGVAWKGIDPPVTVGVTMVGRQEQI